MHIADRHENAHLEEPEIHVEMDPITALPIPLPDSGSSTHSDDDAEEEHGGGHRLRVHTADVVDFRRSSIPSLSPAIPEPEPEAAALPTEHPTSLIAAVVVLIFYCMATIADQQLLKNVFSEDFYAPFFILYVNNLMRLFVLPGYVLIVWIKSHCGRRKRKTIRQILKECSIFKSPDPLPIFFIKTIGILGSNIVLAVSLCIIALSYATASEVACVQTTQVAMVYFAAVVFFGQQVLFAKVLAVLISLSGVAVIAYSKGFQSSSSLGIGLTVIATSIFCFNIMYYKHVYKRLTFGQCCCFLTTAASFTVAIFWTIPLWMKMTYAEVWSWESIPWNWMLLSGICSLFAAKLMNYGLIVATPLLMSFGSLLRIPGNMGIDYFLRHVEFSHLEIIGSILIVLGFIIIVIPDHRMSINCRALFKTASKKSDHAMADPPVEKVYPKRKSVIRKYVEKSEDEPSSTASSDHVVVEEPQLNGKHSPAAAHDNTVFVEPLPTDTVPAAVEVTFPMGEDGSPYVDPLANVLTVSAHGSQIWSSASDCRSLSADSFHEDAISVTNSNATQAQDIESLVRRKSLVEEVLQEWKSLVKQSLNVDHLFSLEELNKHLPHHHLRVFIGTWNVNGQETFGDLKDFLFPKKPAAAEMCDLYAIGVQEGIPEFRTWEVGLQKTIGLSHVLYASESVGTIHISIFLRRDLIWFCTKPLVSRHHLRLINQKNSKGFVGVMLYLFGSSFMFLTSHLTAGHSREKVDVRIDQLNRIYMELNLPRSLEQNRLGNRFDAVDYVFWFGDFNFRLNETRENVETTISGARSSADNENGEHFQKLLMWDQLYTHKTRCAIHDFSEHPISFLPTYKFDLNSDHYDRSSKQRIPSYTDRILFRSNGKGNPIICRCYGAATSIKTSDHRPVYAIFDVKVRPQVRAQNDLDICAGQFNREIYTAAVGLLKNEQAIQRAIQKNLPRSTNSAVCVIL
ncbi:uncharacterized protein LOC129587865 [Paramacrobiotus metropolitanus]|uniref:uncharacterized protein LOC129587865 n=1 Tax=Paramacrobiotus metropolitanus TaxID=2943436 RepID=UPI0024464099|nr:uncharacterized protein LOC129587865 [Paramacrobiotus metropolitanus]